MPINFLEKLKEKTEKFELEKEQAVTRTDVLNGLDEVLGVQVPQDAQKWIPETLQLKKLKIDRTTEPEATFEIEIGISEPPPIIGHFLRFLAPKETSFLVMTNQPPKEPGGQGRRKIWGFSVTLDFFGSDMTLKTSSEKPKRFELTGFEMDDDKFREAFQHFGLDLPQEFFDTVPSKKVSITKLVVEEAEPRDYFEFEGSMELRELFGGMLTRFMAAKAKSAGFYYKQETIA